MNFKFNWDTFILLISLLGAIQGFILFVFLHKSRKNKSNLFLSWFVLLLAGIILLNSFQNKIIDFHFLLLFNFLPYLAGPLVYFYLKTYFYHNLQLQSTFIIHTAPAIIHFIIYGLFYLLLDENQMKEYIKNVLEGNPPWFIIFMESAKMISGIVYCALVIKLILSFRINLKESAKKSILRRWFYAIFISFVFCWVIVIANFLAIAAGVNSIWVINLLFVLRIIIFVIFMYTISIYAQYYPFLFDHHQVREKVRLQLNLTEVEIARISQQIDEIMNEEKPYLDDTYSIKKLSQRLNLHSNIISFIINEVFNRNFSEFINDYRLHYFISQISNQGNLSIIRLAYESGFSSKSAFNNAFRNKYQKSPTEYIKLQKNQT